MSFVEPGNFRGGLTSEKYARLEISVIDKMQTFALFVLSGFAIVKCELFFNLLTILSSFLD